MLAVGTKTPGWVKEGYDDYAKRMPAAMKLILEEIAVPSRHGGDVSRRKAVEGEKLLSRLTSNDYVVALDERGREFSTEQLSRRLEVWRQQGDSVALLVGGADGLHDSCIKRSKETWSLSKLTFPHAMVRVIVAEQLYRAHSLLSGHPYHRA
jgi:23S rRNA (pseudouridine1915-N3)-methyltransferase